MDRDFKQKEINVKGGREEEQIELNTFNEFTAGDVAEIDEIAPMQEDDLDSLINDGEQIAFFIRKYYKTLNKNIIQELQKCECSNNQLLIETIKMGQILGQIEDSGYNVPYIINFNFNIFGEKEFMFKTKDIYKILNTLDSEMFDISRYVDDFMDLISNIEKISNFDINVFEKIIYPYYEIVSKVNYHINSINEVIQRWLQKLSIKKPKKCTIKDHF